MSIHEKDRNIKDQKKKKMPLAAEEEENWKLQHIPGRNKECYSCIGSSVAVS